MSSSLNNIEAALTQLSAPNTEVRRRFIRGQLDEKGVRFEVARFESVFGGVGENYYMWGDNIRRESVRIFSAHYDGPNQVDNASGVLCLLFWLRWITSRSKAPHDIMFTFLDAEETFQEGAKVLLGTVPKSRLKAFYNVEAIGLGPWFYQIPASNNSLGQLFGEEDSLVLLTDATIFSQAGINAYDVFTLPDRIDCSPSVHASNHFSAYFSSTVRPQQFRISCENAFQRLIVGSERGNPEPAIR